MATYVNPSNDFRPLSEEMGRVFTYAAHHEGFIADGSTLVADVDSAGLGAGPFNAFAKAGETGLNVDIDTGEAVIQGAIVAKDTTTTVSLPASSSPTVYVGWDPAVENGIIIDHGGNFTSEPKIPLYDFTTDTTNVTGQTDRRVLGQHVDVLNKRYEGSGSMPVDSADNATLADNATNLGGSPDTAFAKLAENETVTGSWDFNGRVTIDVASQHLHLFDSDGGGDGFRMDTDDDQFFITRVDSTGAIVSIPFKIDASNSLIFQDADMVQIPSGDLETQNGTAVTSGIQRRIFVSSGSPTSTDGQDGDIWIEY